MGDSYPFGVVMIASLRKATQLKRIGFNEMHFFAGYFANSTVVDMFYLSIKNENA
jgi:hypothetical protein